MGKLGAIISSVGFFQLRDIGGKNAQIPTLMGIFAGFMLIGLLFTFLIPEPKGRSLEELSNGQDSPSVFILPPSNSETDPDITYF
jgi:PHS family inorganic phosphate transporter-like MFS transporter